jgi:hypothetical protein
MFFWRRFIISALFAIGFLFFIGSVVSAGPIIQPKNENCVNLNEGQDIPANGDWLHICYDDAHAPLNSTVTDVSIKYSIDYSDPGQLEIRLARQNMSVNSTIWKGNAAGAEFGKKVNFKDFYGSPSQGTWVFEVRGTSADQNGKVKNVSLSIQYALPKSQLAGSINYQSLPDLDKGPEAQNQSLLLSSGWQDIKTEDFEWGFPSASWTLHDNNPDGLEYLWNDDYSHYHTPGRAAWPASGGSNGQWIDPGTIEDYPPNLDSDMVFGPFDLSDAKKAEVNFWLWRDIEPIYDHIYVSISTDNVSWVQIASWDGTHIWENENLSLDDYLGHSQVWVGWGFTSDYNNGSSHYIGPWIDDILIHKYVPGQVTVSGTLFYKDRNNLDAVARYTKATLYDADPGGTDDPLETSTFTDINGHFAFPSRLNWDTDDTDPNPENRKLDLYVVWEAEYNDSLTSTRRVTNFARENYKWYSGTFVNVSSESVDLSSEIQSNHVWLPAMWIFQDLRNAWETITYNTNPLIDPGSIRAKWETGEVTSGVCSRSCFIIDLYYDQFVFVSHADRFSADVVIHEAGHNYMYNKVQLWTGEDPGCFEHSIFSLETPLCAYGEGWADFLPLAVYDDHCFDYINGHCNGIPNIDFINLESHNRNDNDPINFPTGDTVEGRVAGALYDFKDSTNDGFDTANFGLQPILNTSLRIRSNSFLDFWNYWKIDHPTTKHDGVQAIYQNGIEDGYDTSPIISGVPALVTLKNMGLNHAFDLRTYSSDAESDVSTLSFEIRNNSGQACGVTIADSHWINVSPPLNWTGSCNVTIRVSDTIYKWSETTFTVAIVTNGIYVPSVIK